MAYVDPERKKIILYPHKTGTNTIRSILKDAGRIDHVRLIGVNNHPTLEQIRYQYPELNVNINDYEVYAFYREPIERHLSFIQYVMNNHIRKPGLTMQEWYEEYGFFAPQSWWITHPTQTINLLDYRKFDAEVRKVLALVGVEAPEVLPRKNASGNTRTVHDLAPDEVAFLKNLLKEDYDALAARGIFFDPIDNGSK